MRGVYSTLVSVFLQSLFSCGPTFFRCRGGALERGFRRVINDVPIGSLLVQSDSKTGEPILLQVKLPLYIRHRDQALETFVFLLDAQVGGKDFLLFDLLRKHRLGPALQHLWPFRFFWTMVYDRTISFL